ncbi:ABC-F family ATP-binding cassette domain-containing protein [Ectopseudomonas mendocina]|uniref:ABC-F family ATP-binding cassette domain-containing protein n=1 Tax=Ectopseudomonas mendocina TaxID=300 RepID=A0ABZ2RKW6_ECTME
MTSTYLTLESVSYVLPTGRTLFSNLNAQFDERLTGLVGRNGIGKSVLAKILAGLLPPSAGCCVRAGSVYYLPQQIVRAEGMTVASLTGQLPVLEAIQRIEAGSVSALDFDAVGECWDIRTRLQQALQQRGLGHLALDTPVSQISGGEAMRVALLGAEISRADYLILDEPSNHLDRLNRTLLIEHIQTWPRGMLVVSHDRELLGGVERIVELSTLGLNSYGGNYDFYVQSRAQQQQSVLERLDQHKREQKREEQNMRKQLERQERRNARGKRTGAVSNQAKILLGQQKGRSEQSSGRLQLQQAALRELRSQEISDIRQQVDEDSVVVMRATSQVRNHTNRQIARVTGQLPYVSADARYVDLTLTLQHRVGVVGPNGCGKTTLLKVLVGQRQLVSGYSDVRVVSAYLDQMVSTLEPHESVLQQLRSANRATPESELRTRLAQLGLDAQKISVPSHQLSGGERIKAALACALYVETPAELLLLDEPSNHLDLPSVHALEEMLCSYQGAMQVVSHDDAFMQRLRLSHRLSVADGGWEMEQW